MSHNLLTRELRRTSHPLVEGTVRSRSRADVESSSHYKLGKGKNVHNILVPTTEQTPARDVCASVPLYVGVYEYLYGLRIVSIPDVLLCLLGCLVVRPLILIVCDRMCETRNILSPKHSKVLLYSLSS